MVKCVWMKVTQDEYELPLAIADTSVELAQICGTTANSIRSTVAKARKGIIRNPSYVLVMVEEGEIND